MRNAKEEIEFEIEDNKKELKVAYNELQHLMENENYQQMDYYGNRIAVLSAKLTELERIHRML